MDAHCAKVKVDKQTIWMMRIRGSGRQRYMMQPTIDAPELTLSHHLNIWKLSVRSGTGYSLFTLKGARSPLILNGERAILRVDRLYIPEINDACRPTKYRGACLNNHALLFSAIR